MKICIWVIVIIISLYLAWSFYNVSFNPAYWIESSRVFVSTFSVFTILMWYLADWLLRD